MVLICGLLCIGMMMVSWRAQLQVDETSSLRAHDLARSVLLGNPTDEKNRARLSQLRHAWHYMTFPSERKRIAEELVPLLKSELNHFPYDSSLWFDLFLVSLDVDPDNALALWAHQRFERLAGWQTKTWLASMQFCAQRYEQLSAEFSVYCKPRLVKALQMAHASSVMRIPQDRLDVIRTDLLQSQ